jgi:hypothetical protein
MSEDLVCNFSNFSEIISIKTNHRKEVQREWTFVRTQKGYFISEISLRKKVYLILLQSGRGKIRYKTRNEKNILFL